MNGAAMNAFLESYNRTSQMLDERDRRKQEMSMRQQQMHDQSARQTAADTRQQTLDTQNAADRERKIAQEKISLMPSLAELGGTAESPEDAQRLIETVMPELMRVYGQDTMGYGMPAVEMASRTITARQQRQVKEYIGEVLKTSFISDNPDSDPVIDNLPAHVAKVIGKPSARLSELQQKAELPIGKPQQKPSEIPSLQSKELIGANGQPGVFNFDPKNGSYTPAQGVSPSPPRASAGADPEIADLRKELLRLQVDNAGKPKDPNQAQFTSAGYAARVEQAEPILTKVAPSITGMSLPVFQLQTDSWFAKPTFQSAEVQSYMQSARNFINAVLRRESGAVISPEEFKEAKAQYLPVAGDTPEALALKAANRATVANNLKRSAGPAYEPPVSPSPAPMKPASSHGPALKERRKAPDGSLIEWDGKGWKIVR